MINNNYQLSPTFVLEKLNVFIRRTFGLIAFISISFAVYSQKTNSTDEIAKWEFNTENIGILNDEIIATDQSYNGYVGTFKNNAKLRTIGITTMYNVLDLGNGTGYFDMSTEIGEEIYKLSNITVKGQNDYGDGAISTLAIAVATAEEKEIADTAQNCIDTLILSASKVFPVILSLNPLGYGPDIIGLQIAEQGTNKEVTQFTMHVASAKDTTIYLKAGKYNLNWTDGGANLQNPKLSGDHISVSGAGWVMGEKYLGIEFKVIDMPIVCEGQVTLKASTYFTGNGNLKYKWSPTTGLNNDTIANPTATVTNDITYTVTVTSPNGCEASVDLKLNALALTANAGNDKTIVCGGTAQLNSVTSNYTGKGRLRYNWIPSDGLSSDTIANPKAKVAQNTTYYVTVTSPLGCTATDSVKVLVSPLSVNAGSNKTITCGGSALLNNLTTNYTGTGNLKYKWQPANGLNNDSIVNPIATVTDNSTYYVTVTSPDGCTATDSIRVLVLPMTLRVTNDTTVECGNSIGLFVEKEYQEGETLKYKWIPSTGLDNDSIAFPVCSATTKTTYTVTVTSSTGCVSSANITVDMLPMIQPEIGIVGVTNNNFNQIAWNKKESECIDSYLIYKETNTTNVFEKIGVVPYDSMSVFVDILSNPNVKSNKYRLSTLDKNGFESTQSYAHKTMHLTINKGQSNAWNLIWEPYEGFLVATYNIYRGNNINNLNFIDATSGSSTQYTDFNAQSGDVYYQVEVISPKLINPSKTNTTNQKTKESQNSLSSIYVSYNSSRSNIVSNLLNSIPEFSEKSINIYPNPFKNELRIDLVEGTAIQILNLTGQCVYAGNVDRNTLIDTSKLSTGIYMIKFKTANSYEYRKIIKE